MKTIYSIKTLCIVALLGCFNIVNAQEENPLNREMTLEREYDPAVQDANKVNTLPVVKEPEIRRIPIDYAAFTIAGTPDKEISLLPSGKVMTDILYNKRRGYLNLAGGTYMNLNGDLGYHILSTDKDQLNIFVSHRSTNGKVKYIQDVPDGEDDKVKAKINETIGGVNFRHAFDKATMKLGAKYGYSAFNYYGYPIASPPSSVLPDWKKVDRDTKQANQQIQINAGVASNSDEPISYLLDIDYTNFSQKYGDSKEADGLTEHTVGILFDLNAGFSGNQKIGLGGKLNYLAYSIPSDLTFYGGAFDNHLVATLSPYYRVEGDNWNIKLGANAMFVTGEFSKVFVSPNITADIQVAEKTVLYLNAGGEAQANSMNDMAQRNRYIAPYGWAKTSRTWLDAIVGIKSGVAPGFWFNVFGGYKITDDDCFFMQSTYNQHPVNDLGFSNYSVPNHYDSKRFIAGIELKYAYQKLFDVSLKGIYNNWDISSDDDGYYTEPKAFGRPEMELTAGLDIRPIDKVTVGLDYYLATGRYANTYGVFNEKMNNINELNITGSYAFNDTFGAYVKLNNVLFQKYEYIYGYPMQRFSAMVGVNINF